MIDPIEPSSLAPVFDEFFSDPLYENVAPGTFVTTVFASDYDSNSNDVIYTITGKSQDLNVAIFSFFLLLMGKNLTNKHA